MNRSHTGFTIIELAIVILVGSILTSIVYSGFSSALGGFSVRGARDTFAAMHARTRAQAIESGKNLALYISASGDSVVISDGSTTYENVDFMGEFNINIIAGANLIICMNPRGYADTDCNSFDTTVTVGFVQGADTSALQILPLGQLVY